MNDTTNGRGRLSAGGADLWVLLVLAVGVALGAAATAAGRVAGNWGERSVAVRLPTGSAVSVRAPAGFVADDVGGTLVATRGSYAVWSIGQALSLLAVAVIAAAVAVVLDDARRRSAFTNRGVKAWWVAAGASLIGQAGAFGSSMGELGSKIDAELSAETTTSLMWVPLSLVFVVLASVFRRGVALRDDVEHTI